ncbi:MULTISPECIES: histidine phosphatase family protein [unclassified Haladaptatus]|uniref:histidine phosphatase family protein n=1 Tax=unclassified Haladaptatus TaxID=2622732 RepID=UPI0023E7FE05|nr:MULTISPECIES: histidine phosphatase family protein [unclassified Haladaptatus]
MTVVYFVRHAHSPWLPNQEATRPLSQEGHAAARAVAASLSDRPPAAIYASPYERAVQTVEPIAADHGLDIELVPEFRERTLTDGPAENIGETFESAIDAVWSDWTVSWPGGESNWEAQARGVTALERILDAHPDDHVVVGTHGNLLTLILNHYDDRFDFAFWRDELRTPDCLRAVFEDGVLATTERIDTASPTDRRTT